MIKMFVASTKCLKEITTRSRNFNVGLVCSETERIFISSRSATIKCTSINKANFRPQFVRVRVGDIHRHNVDTMPQHSGVNQADKESLSNYINNAVSRPLKNYPGRQSMLKLLTER